MEIQRLQDGVSSIYNLGSAHGRRVYPNLAEFGTRVFELIEQNPSKVYVALSNNSQVKERDFLTSLGFLFCKTTGSVKMQYASDDTLKSHAKEFEELVKKAKADLLIRDENVKKWYANQTRSLQEFKVGDFLVTQAPVDVLNIQTSYIYRLVEQRKGYGQGVGSIFKYQVFSGAVSVAYSWQYDYPTTQRCPEPEGWNHQFDAQYGLENWKDS